MQKLVEVRKRMATVRSIRQVARTMATVASAKLSRTRERASGLRAYVSAMRDLIRRQQAYATTQGVDLSGVSPFLRVRPARRVLVVHLAGDRGMCGAYNMAVNHSLVAFLDGLRAGGVEADVWVKGAKAQHYLAKRENVNMIDATPWSRSGVTGEEVGALFDRVSGDFLSGCYDEVWCSYTLFLSPLRRYPRVVKLLPITAPEDESDEAGRGGPVARAAAVAPPGPGASAPGASGTPERWFYEPAVEPILAELLAEFLRMQVEDVLLESFASEQGARMITMEEATERADRTLQELTVAHNRLRREAITTDLLGVLFASRLRAEERQATRLTAAS